MTGRRLLGVALIVGAVAPLYRLMPVDAGAPVRAALLTRAGFTQQYALWGTLVVLASAYLLARGAPDLPRRFGARVAEVLSAVDGKVFAAACGLLAFGAALTVSYGLFRGLFTHVDEMASFIQARYLAQGMLAGPGLPLPEAWLIPNTLTVDQGWVSQYPPSHLAVMAAFVAVGLQGLMSPTLLGVMAVLTALCLERLMPDHAPEVRLAALFTAVSPLMVVLGGGALSHLTAGCALLVVLWSALAARNGHAGWALLSGAAIGVAVMARPLIGLLLGAVFTLGVWGPVWLGGATAGGVPAPGLPVGRTATRWLGTRLGWTMLGGLPFAALLGAYHAHLFGGATRWGYLAAFGDEHGLGFHDDPWGYAYGPVEAVALTSADLIAVGVHLLETPVPLVLAVGVWLLLSRPPLPTGAGLLLAWATVPILGNAAYWFHSDRMYFEAAPAWIALAVLAVATGSRPAPRPSRFDPAPWVGWGALLSLVVAAVWGAPLRWQSLAWDDETLTRIRVPEVPGGQPALVFVHTPWDERLSATLQGAGGMRQDSVTSALRRNPTCTLHRYARERAVAVTREGPTPSTPVDLSGSPGAPLDLRLVRAGPGPGLRVRAGDPLTPECLRELRADRFGSVALAPLLWQGDLPGAERGLPMFVRDLGPETNVLVRTAFPERTSWVFTPVEEGGAPVMVPYEQAMTLLWEELTPDAHPAPESAPSVAGP